MKSRILSDSKRNVHLNKQKPKQLQLYWHWDRLRYMLLWGWWGWWWRASSTNLIANHRCGSLNIIIIIITWSSAATKRYVKWRWIDKCVSWIFCFSHILMYMDYAYDEKGDDGVDEGWGGGSIIWIVTNNIHGFNHNLMVYLWGRLLTHFSCKYK